MRCVGSITADWTGASGSGTCSIPTGRNIKFNAVKVSQVLIWDPMSGPVYPYTLFVQVPELSTVDISDIVDGKEFAIVGQGQWTGGGYLFFGQPDHSDIKRVSRNPTNFRGGSVLFNLVGANGNVLGPFPLTTKYSVTLQLWQIEN